MLLVSKDMLVPPDFSLSEDVLLQLKAVSEKGRVWSVGAHALAPIIVKIAQIITGLANAFSMVVKTALLVPRGAIMALTIGRCDPLEIASPKAILEHGKRVLATFPLTCVLPIVSLFSLKSALQIIHTLGVGHFPPEKPATQGLWSRLQGGSVQDKVNALLEPLANRFRGASLQQKAGLIIGLYVAYETLRSGVGAAGVSDAEGQSLEGVLDSLGKFAFLRNWVVFQYAGKTLGLVCNLPLPFPTWLCEAE